MQSRHDGWQREIAATVNCIKVRWLNIKERQTLFVRSHRIDAHAWGGQGCRSFERLVDQVGVVKGIGVGPSLTVI